MAADYPPEYDDPCICEVCGASTDDCDCPTCAKCGEVGNAKCYQDHGLAPAGDSVQSFVDHIGIDPIRDALHAIDKHNTEHVWLVFRQPLPGLNRDVVRVYYHAEDDVFAAIQPWMRLSAVGVGGIAWDGSDWEHGEEVPAGNGWGSLDAAREGFADALAEYEAQKENDNG